MRAKFPFLHNILDTLAFHLHKILDTPYQALRIQVNPFLVINNSKIADG